MIEKPQPLGSLLFWKYRLDVASQMLFQPFFVAAVEKLAGEDGLWNPSLSNVVHQVSLIYYYV